MAMLTETNPILLLRAFISVLENDLKVFLEN